MKNIKQLMIILMISFIGEVFNHYLPFPVPASIYGLAILFLGLETGVIHLEAVEDTAKYLVEIMPLMFIPAGVGLINSWGILKPIWLQITTIMLVSTVAVMAVAGRVTQFVIRKQNKK